MTYALEDLKWIKATPCTKLKLPKGGAGQLPYTETEIRRFRERTPRGARSRLAFELLLCTAARISDVTMVETDRFRENVIDILSQKTGALTVAGSTVELIAAFAAWEAVHLGGSASLGRYALGGEGGSPLNRRTLTKDLEQAYRAAGFPPEKCTHAGRNLG